MDKPDDAYRTLIASSRVSTRTRAALQERGLPDDPAYRPAAMNQAQFATLRALLDRVLPQPGAKIDLAARIDASLARGAPRGWRFAALPPDDQACRLGLDTLDEAARTRHGMSFSALPVPLQDAMIEAAKSATQDATHLALWLEDITAFAVQAFMSHPATLARIGYSGIAYGGDGEPKSGFRLVGAGEREGWEPEANPKPVP